MGNRVAFERRRAEAEKVASRMPPSMLTDCYYKTGVGLARFGQIARAANCSRGAGLAETHRLNAWYFRCERVLANLTDCEFPEPASIPPASANRRRSRRWRSGSANTLRRRASCSLPESRTRASADRRPGGIAARAGGGGQAARVSEAIASHFVVVRVMVVPFGWRWGQGHGPICEGPRRFRPFLRQIGADLRHFVLAAVPAERLFRLRSLDPDRFVWEAVSTWPEAVEAIRARPVQMAVVDPLLGGPSPAPTASARPPVLPLPAAPGVHRARARHRRRAAGARTDGHPPRRRASVRGRAGLAPDALLAELEQSASQQVSLGLGQILRELPPELRLALEGMLHAPGEGPTVTALADGPGSPAAPASAGSPRWACRRRGW